MRTRRLYVPSPTPCPVTNPYNILRHKDKLTFHLTSSSASYLRLRISRSISTRSSMPGVSIQPTHPPAITHYKPSLITNHTDHTAGDDKPTGKALSEQLGKYRKPGSSITFRYTKSKRAAPDGSGSSAPNTPTPKRNRKTNGKASKVKAEVPSSPVPVPKIKGEIVEDDKKFLEA